ncbi:hypothetical protein ABH931_002435 [Streptacidiphilus sp. MAP12-33]|uniref:hypothetical protein n=1 Tax=Streptacidiphilus sp. MAP12-33 TaxID=3156266 RepID=UPI00351414B0
MRLVQGVSLERRTAEGKTSLKQVTAVAVAVLRALGAVYQAGIVCRDVKPAASCSPTSGSPSTPVTALDPATGTQANRLAPAGSHSG